MSRPTIGQVLGWMGKLGTIDVQEILAEQAVTHEKFGQIAMALGMCEPEHVWEAWCMQLALGTDRVSLEDVGIDAHAIAGLPPQIARDLHVVPIRSIGDQVIVATSHPLDSETIDDLGRATGKHLRFVLADPNQIERAITTYYGVVEAAQAAA